MGAPRLPDDEFIARFQQVGAVALSKELGISERNIYSRRLNLETKYGPSIISPRNKSNRLLAEYPNRIHCEVQNGVVMIGSDAHLWPGDNSCAFRGFLHMIPELKPVIVDINGDVHDGARTGRHPPRGWKYLPSVMDELKYDEEQLDIIREKAKGSRLIWTLGNHDFRFEARLAQDAPEFEGVPGFSLKDRFPHWDLGISLWINKDIVVKHRWKGGIHAAHNNAVGSGKTMVTGHLHSLKVTPWTDYNGTRYGVDTGTLSEVIDAEELPEQFDYVEDNPVNWRAGFVVLTFHKGKLLQPETARVIDKDHIEFRGKVIKV